MKEREPDGDCFGQVGRNPNGENEGAKIIKKEPKRKGRGGTRLWKIQANTLEGVCWKEGVPGAKQVDT